MEQQVLTIIGCVLISAANLALFRRQRRRNRQDKRDLKRVNQQLQLTNAELEATSIELANYNDRLEAYRDEVTWLVKERTREIQADNARLREEIIEKTLAEQQLLVTMEALSQQNSELDNYVYRVSHDLRAPLNSIRGLTNLIEATENVETIKEYVRLIEGRIYKSDEFIKSILTQSRALNTKLNIAPRPLQADHRRLYGRIALPAQPASRITISVSEEGPAEFYSDWLRVSIIFKNFISNAVKYADPYAAASYLQFHIRQDEERAHILVKDNGIGIDPEHLSRIFDMFYRATERSDGSGLGLYIVHRTIVMLDGSISVSSQPGQGTTFELTLANFKNSLVSAC